MEKKGKRKVSLFSKREKQVEKNSSKVGFNFDEIGPRELLMDEQTAIVIFRACGMPIPMTKEEWEEYRKKIEELLKKISEKQRERILITAGCIGAKRKQITSEYKKEIDDSELVKLGEKIPLKSPKINSLGIIENFNNLSQEQRDLIVEMIQTGIDNQGHTLKSLQFQFEKDANGNKIKTIADEEPDSSMDLDI